MAVPLIIPLVAAGAQIGGSVFSFIQARKARDAEKKAQREAARAMAEAKAELDVNYLKGLSIAKEPYELEMEAIQQAAASALQAGVEGDPRGAAATAGRVMQAQQNALARQRAAMSQEMSQLEKLVAQEDARLGTARASVDLGEAQGAQAAAQDAAMMAQWNTQQGIQQGVEGVTGLLTSGLFDSTPEGIARRESNKANRQLDRYRKTPEYKIQQKKMENTQRLEQGLKPLDDSGLANFVIPTPNAGRLSNANIPLPPGVMTQAQGWEEFDWFDPESFTYSLTGRKPY